MKKLLLLTSACFALTQAAQAQITLTAAIHMPAADTLYYATFSNPTVPAPGTNMTWNYASVTPVGLDTVGYFNCIPQASCGGFSNANLLMGNPADTTYQYFKTNATVFQATGSAGPSSQIRFTDLHDVQRYPFTYNDGYNDPYDGVINFDFSGFPMTLAVGGTDSVSAPGYGTLTTPLATYTNTLLVHSEDRFFADFTFIGGDTTRIHVVTYSWYDAAHRLPLARIIYQYSVDSDGVETLSGSQGSYLSNTPSAVITASGVENFQLVPNPSAGITYLDVPASFSTPEASVLITDLSGKMVYQRVLGGLSYIPISTAEWAKGIYFVRLQKSDGKTLFQKLSVQ